MNGLKYFLTEYGQQIQVIFFIAMFVISWNIENAAGVVFNYKKWRHAFINSRFIITNIPGQLLLGLAFVKTTEWTTSHQFGFLYHLSLVKNSVILFLVTFVFLDLGEYVYHVIMHKVKRLWMFHMLHHTDRVLDITTSLRVHPADTFARLSFTLLVVFLSGAALWTLLLRQIIQVVATLFAHMNYRLPDKVDRILSLLFVTPNLHQVHHHYKQPYTDCNYGDVLSIWDRLFGTFRTLPADRLIFGVDTYVKQENMDRFASLIKIPFEYRKARVTTTE